MSIARKIRCTVASVTDHGGRVYTVDLAPHTSVPAFRSGQFLHLTVDHYDPSGFWPESRVFSIASSPRDPQRLRICYSVKGRYTSRMQQRLKPGAEVWVKMPYGDFLIDDRNDAVLLAGGTGISAFVAFVEGLQPDDPRKLWLVYGAREPGLLLFSDLLLEQSSKLSNLNLLFFTEVAGQGIARRMGNASRRPQCFEGRIDLDLVWRCVEQPASKVFYVSGPPAMLATLSQQLLTRGVPASFVRTDAWE